MGKTLLVAALATVLGLAALWAVNINIAAWAGSWVSPDDAQNAGLSIFAFLGLFGGVVYQGTLGSKFGGPGAVRGLIFGLILAAVMTWPIPIFVKAAGIATGDARQVYGGQGDSNSYAVTGGDAKVKDHDVGDAPVLFDVEPPLKSVTQGQKWTHADDWQGRILPFLIGFWVYGLVLGLVLSEDPHKQNF